MQFTTLKNGVVMPMLGFGLPVFLVFSKVYMKKMRRLTKDIRTTDSRVQSLLQESLQHHVVIRSMERSHTMAAKLRTVQQKLYQQIIGVLK